MKQIRTSPQRPTRATQRGFSIIELSIAMIIAVFLLAGLFTILQGTRNTSVQQTALAQLQDNERLAMSLLTAIVESAGYYSYSATSGLTDVFQVDGTTFATAGQSVGGGGNGPQGDNLVVRFQASPGDGVSSCMGRTNSAALPVVYKNTFTVDAATQSLQCSDANGVRALTLVNGVQSMTIRWGVNSAATLANSNCPADTYFLTKDMTNLAWTNVCTVEITLIFLNPLRQLVPGGPIDTTQDPTVQFTKVITVMAKSGNNV